jgi:hypothetical protein
MSSRPEPQRAHEERELTLRLRRGDRIAPHVEGDVLEEVAVPIRRRTGGYGITMKLDDDRVLPLLGLSEQAPVDDVTSTDRARA